MYVHVYQTFRSSPILPVRLKQIHQHSHFRDYETFNKPILFYFALLSIPKTFLQVSIYLSVFYSVLHDLLAVFLCSNTFSSDETFFPDKNPSLWKEVLIKLGF